MQRSKNRGRRDDEEDHDQERTPLHAKLWLNDKRQNQEKNMVVAKIGKNVPENPFVQTDPDGNDIPADKVIKGGKALEEEDFSSGFLILPPGGKKHPESPQMTEVFYVIDSAYESLKVTLQDHTLTLSKGDIFFVPPANEYHLSNSSEDRDVRLFFCLLKHAMLVESDEEEEEEDGEDPEDEV